MRSLSSREYHFIDLNKAKMDHLQRLAGNSPNVHFYPADCNEVLIRQLFPALEYKSYRRALGLLDPYGLHLNWDVMFQAGQLKTVDLFLNFPVMDITDAVEDERFLGRRLLAAGRVSTNSGPIWNHGRESLQCGVCRSFS